MAGAWQSTHLSPAECSLSEREDSASPVLFPPHPGASTGEDAKPESNCGNITPPAKGTCAFQRRAGGETEEPHSLGDACPEVAAATPRQVGAQHWLPEEAALWPQEQPALRPPEGGSPVCASGTIAGLSAPAGEGGAGGAPKCWQAGPELLGAL